jgi:uncharacterized protein
VARRIVQACGRDIRAIMGNPETLRGLSPQDFVDDAFGLPTVRDILSELEKPGRDPRPAFVTARFAEGVETMADLKPGMLLEGTVTNVTAFGAFVDIGVHQDGLVHISQLADRFVQDPHSVVKAGDVLKVRVLDVDMPRKRIALTMRKQAEAQGDARPGSGAKPPRGETRAKAAHAKPAHGGKSGAKSSSAPLHGSLGDALVDAMRKRN